MARGSARKKSSRRLNSNLTSQQQQRQQQHTSMIPMATPASPFHLIRNRRIFLPTSFALLCGMTIIIFTVTSPPPSAFEPNVWSSSLHTGEVINEFPHDAGAFTQGLLYAGNDTLFESTGLLGRSSVRKVALNSGKVQAIQNMDRSYFGEGLTLLGERLFQVTWLKTTGFIYDRNNLSKLEKFSHQMKDGWGLATDGKILFGTDGSSTLYQIDPQTMNGLCFRGDFILLHAFSGVSLGFFNMFDLVILDLYFLLLSAVIGKQIVKYRGLEVPNLNELEYVNGEVWANVWQTDCIARISYNNGTVIGWILLPNLREGLLATGYRGIDVLNGIAWDREKKRLFVTGKLWPKLYEIKLHPIQTPFSGDIEHICIPMPAQF